jgi:hypothetical protein
MMMSIYCIKDVKSKTIQSQLMMFENKDIAIRWFHQVYLDSVASAPNGSLALYPEDFELVELGYIDLSTGAIDSDGSCLFICSANRFSCLEV